MSGPTNASAPRARLGELLVQAGVLAKERLDEALRLQSAEGGRRRLGRLLVEQGFVDETLLTQVLGRHLSVPWVSLYHVDFSRQLLNLVPREVAEGYGLIPVYVRHVRGQGDTLYVATDDPTNEDGLRRASAYAGLPVRPMIASASDIRAAIRAYYGGGAPSAPKVAAAPKVEHVEPAAAAEPTEPAAPPAIEKKSSAEPPRKPAAPPPRRSSPEPVPEPEPEPAPAPAREPEPAPRAASAPYDDTPDIEAKSISLPPRRRGKAIALTFLDGTTISLPAPRGPRGRTSASAEEPAASGGDPLTARDLVAALRAVAQGAEPGEILGENPRWEAMFAALLSLLLKKHLVADWEFVEELEKITSR